MSFISRFRDDNIIISAGELLGGIFYIKIDESAKKLESFEFISCRRPYSEDFAERIKKALSYRFDLNYVYGSELLANHNFVNDVDFIDSDNSMIDNIFVSGKTFTLTFPLDLDVVKFNVIKRKRIKNKSLITLYRDLCSEMTDCLSLAVELRPLFKDLDLRKNIRPVAKPNLLFDLFSVYDHLEFSSIDFSEFDNFLSAEFSKFHQMYFDFGSIRSNRFIKAGITRTVKFIAFDNHFGVGKELTLMSSDYYGVVLSKMLIYMLYKKYNLSIDDFLLSCNMNILCGKTKC